MKVTLSLTLDKELVAFIDHEPGATRSEKIEFALRRYRDVQRDVLLREELRAAGTTAGDSREHEAWVRVMQDGM
ncbi:MAG: hypothetical protein Q7J25_13060 [Vicinamibacterales bacterium]|nr:hypothetical protein [Vicinamibacterales bacterium]